jgi:NitT/TauT family transport system substrate-binding protein
MFHAIASSRRCLRQGGRFAVAALVLLAAGVVGVTSSCSRDAAEPFRLGINPFPTWEYFHLAAEKGLYERCGVDVRIVEFDSLGDAKRAFERGQVDAFLGTLVEVATARPEGGRIPVVAFVTDYSCGADRIVGRRGLAGVADLVGRRVAVEPASLNVFVLVRALEKHGLATTDVTMVELDPLSMLEEFRRGAVDAIVAYPPVSLDALAEPDAASLFSSADIEGEVVDVLAVDRARLERAPEDLIAIHRAYRLAIEYHAANEEESIAIMAKREGADPREFARALREDVRIVSAESQQSYLAPGGRLEQLYAVVQATLGLSPQPSAPAPVAHSLSDRLIGTP